MNPVALEVVMPRPRKWLLAGFAALCLGGCLLFLACTVQVLDGEGWVRSAVSIRNIGEALRLYHEAHGRLPPAVARGKDGEPLYSWRVLLLPYIEQGSLYQQFHLDEPWDGPHNMKLAEKTPKCYEPALGGEDAPGLTRYQVFVGMGTAFERDGLTWEDFPDGLAATILVAEAGQSVPWSKPADLAYDPGQPLPLLGSVFTKPAHFLCYEIRREPGFNACFADATSRFISSRTDERTIRGLITRNGGEKVEPSKLE
jgi:hypothetical protein